MRWLLIVALLALSACRHGQKEQGLSALMTTPIPLPAPAIPRHKMSEQLQELWTRVELAVEVAPPSPPENATDESIKAWADGPFTDWILARAKATTYALQATYAMRVQPPYERGIGTTLYAYLYEDLTNAIRGAPVPENIAEDRELLKVYTNELDKYLKPYAIFAAQGYAACVDIFSVVAAREWQSWTYYCDQRGAEVVKTYDLTEKAIDDVPTELQQAPAPATEPKSKPAMP